MASSCAPGCPKIVDFGQGLILNETGPARVVCAGDTAIDPSGRVLAYDTASRVGNFECTSRASGVSCRNTRSGHGFEISRQRYHLS